MAAIELFSTPLYTDSRLIAYYRFNSGALTTDSKASYTLTNNGTVAETASGKFGYGSDGGATNSSKYFSIASALGLSGGAAAKSISVWFKMNTELSGADSYAALVSIANADTDTQFRIGYWRDVGVNKFIVNRGKNGIGTTPLSTNTSLGTAAFHHAVLTWNGTTLRGYLDNTSLGTDTPSGNGNNGLSDGMTILRDTNANYQSAIIDDVAIFNAALTSTEVSNLYNGTWPGKNLALLGVG